ncbi:filamentous hemagglutinin, partial [Vibrio gazogenes DSM 21264]
GLAGGLNNYQYVVNPTGWVDPLGLSQCLGSCPGSSVPLTQEKIDEIRSIPHGSRPDPSKYLSKDHIESHLAQFDNGASRFMTETNLQKYGIGQRDGTSFVMTNQEATSLLNSTKGSASAMEKALGLPNGFLDGNQLVRVDIPKPRELNLRMPSGNEAGANSQWIPGGRLPDGNLEAVIDATNLQPERYKVTTLHFNIPKPKL